MWVPSPFHPPHLCLRMNVSVSEPRKSCYTHGNLPGCCHPIIPVTVSSGSHPIFLSSQVSQVGGGHGKTRGLHDHGLTVTLLL